MKNWETLEPDAYALMRKHFTRGRTRPIDRIVIHHNAGVKLTGEWLRDETWGREGRVASAHYQVEDSGRIVQLVNDFDTAWHAANADINARSIGIEHANISGPPRWQISDKTIEEGAHLVAALCRAYKLGRPEWGRNVFPHSQFASTSCPYQLAPGGEDHTTFMRRAVHWYDHPTGSTPKPPAPKETAPMANEKFDRIYHELTHKFQTRVRDADGKLEDFRDTLIGYILEIDKKVELGGVEHLDDRLAAIEKSITKLATKIEGIGK